MRLIDKDVLLKELGITDEDCSKCDRGDGNGYCTLSSDWTYACDAICTAPTIEERKKGKWIDKSGDIYGAWNYCSVCGEQAIDLFDFCPNCGADMRGEKDA